MIQDFRYKKPSLKTSQGRPKPSARNNYEHSKGWEALTEAERKAYGYNFGKYCEEKNSEKE